MRENTFATEESARAVMWKRTSPTMPDAARLPAQCGGDRGLLSGPMRDVCLPPGFASLSLLPEVRSSALKLFADLGIAWHNGIGAGPGNHLRSSQIQCVNALGQMVSDPSKIIRVFGPLLGTDDVLQVEPGRYLTFEYIGDFDFFGEGNGRARVRGSRCTSIDAAFLHRTTDGATELVLIEWKYTESYAPRSVDERQDLTRWHRYGAALSDPAGPVRSGLLEFTDLLQEPLYQLVRQQLLADALEAIHAHGADQVRVVLVSPAENVAYEQSLASERYRTIALTVSDVWRELLRRRDRFTKLDSAIFADPDVTSHEYVARYGREMVPCT